MSSRQSASGPPVEANGQDWAAVSLSIMTIATIIAAATAAAAISVVRGDADEDITTITTVASVAAVASLSVYYLVLLAGLMGLFWRPPQERRLWVMASAGLLTVQTGVVAAFAFLTILEPSLFAGG